MNKHTSLDLDSQLKTCNRCKQTKPGSEFYRRSGAPHMLLTECKACMKERAHSARKVSRNQPVVPSEQMAIDALRAAGIFATTGKAVFYADVDVVAWGCVRIEVKYARLGARAEGIYTFVATPRQQQRGMLADIIMLICDDGEQRTFHLFKPDHPVFFKDGRMKTAFTFRAGALKPLKHGNNRVVMTQPMMDAHHNNFQMVWQVLRDKSRDLRSESSQ